MQDIAGLGAFFGHVKDLVIKILDLRASRERRELENERLRIENQERRLELRNARKRRDRDNTR